MTEQPLTTITATELQQKSGEILRRIAKVHERFLVERAGHPVAVVLSLDDYRRLAQENAPTK